MWPKVLVKHCSLFKLKFLICSLTRTKVRTQICFLIPTGGSQQYCYLIQLRIFLCNPSPNLLSYKPSNVPIFTKIGKRNMLKICLFAAAAAETGHIEGSKDWNI